MSPLLISYHAQPSSLSLVYLYIFYFQTVLKISVAFLKNHDKAFENEKSLPCIQGLHHCVFCLQSSSFFPLLPFSPPDRMEKEEWQRWREPRQEKEQEGEEEENLGQAAATVSRCWEKGKNPEDKIVGGK